MQESQDEPEYFLKISRLIRRYILNESSPEEIRELTQWLAKDESNKELFIKLANGEYISEHLALLEEVDVTKAWERFQHSINRPENKSVRFRWFYYAAAIFVGIISTISLFLTTRHQKNHPDTGIIAYMGTNSLFHNDVAAPSGKTAILTLANGKKVSLGQYAQLRLRESDSTLLDNDSNVLTYYHPGGSNREKVLYNKLETPAGSTYHLALSDGTQIWLNAGSSVRFPTAFHGIERNVYLTGEAYFEVNSDPTHPFLVETPGGMAVNVLGTHFDVMAYGNENKSMASLLQGKIRVRSTNPATSSCDLQVGQAGIYNHHTGQLTMRSVDTSMVVAWRKGLFMFENNRLSDVMNQLSRWYDIAVEYKSDRVRTMHFTGVVSRQENLSKVLEMLQLTGGAHFSIEGKKVTIME